MKGLEIVQNYYRTYGEGLLREQFPELVPYVAVGLIGSGSECFGYDDEVSRDHDYGPDFCVFLPREDVVDRRAAFQLERALAKLPKEFQGVTRPMQSPVGGARRGVLRTAEFFLGKTGAADGVLTLQQWLTVPSSALAEAVNGEIWADPYGEVTRIRGGLAAWPEDIRKKKLAGNLLLMAQSGQYNYTRCIRHGEQAAAQMAVAEFVRHTMEAVFLLNNAYMPYYKWSFRAMRALPKLALEAELLEYLLTTDNEESMAADKYDVIEGIASDIIEELQEQGLTEAICGDLEKHAYSVNDGIAESELRNLHILAAV